MTVVTPGRQIPWPEVSRLNDEEMKALMTDAEYHAMLAELLDDAKGPALLQTLSQRDPLPQWNDPQ